ncbi:hypothetical protein A7985_02085 [Pseudoalteromonas luteoviolacea]|uniref:TonB C-terminal domain-containing protein n=1 Tax=Pseudoalteromonas luteoviolacea TaxID=43657 RepID=A0A1C0TTX7_9GAMM|nr:energy transducer TonB [Pseudoalteromonas luteoviolacea]OCQ22770.1 hypothetical protein A7985_02085 [Pseudoalteromonas luteoviolacea]
MNLISAMILTAASSQVGNALDIETNDFLRETITNAVPIERPPATFPRKAAERGQEGWVQLSYVVNEKGEVESAVVEKSSGITSFEKAALKAVKKWQFEPAVQNGKPIKQCKSQVQMDFKLHNAQKGVSRRFLSRYKSLVAKIESNDLEGVPEKIEELREMNLGNFTEDSYFWAVISRYHLKTGNELEELNALENLVRRGKNYLQDDMYSASVARATLLNLKHNKLKNAMRTFDTLTEIKGAEDITKKIAPYIDQVHAFIDDDSKQIWVKGEISEQALWHHELVRSAFTITNIEGDLTSLEVRCLNQFSVYDVQPGLQWNIPAGWRGCQVYVHGSEGASFNLVETALAKKKA